MLLKQVCLIRFSLNPSMIRSCRSPYNVQLAADRPLFSINTMYGDVLKESLDYYANA